jgi:hypothetical protein
VPKADHVLVGGCFHGGTRNKPPLLIRKLNRNIYLGGLT